MAINQKPKLKRVGAAVYRLDQSQIKFLLVTQAPKADLWILPGGRQNPDEPPQHTACREVLEEAGCEIRVQQPLGTFSCASQGEAPATTIYLARLLSAGMGDEGREVTWLTLEEVSHFPVPPETRVLLGQAQALLEDRIQKAEQAARALLGETVTVTVDRPIGTRHAGIRYPWNYGFIDGVMGKDGDDLDAYVLRVDQPVQSYTGKCVAIITRTNDLDDKLVVIPQDSAFNADRIRRETHFVEKYFKSKIIFMAD